MRRRSYGAPNPKVPFYVEDVRSSRQKSASGKFFQLQRRVLNKLQVLEPTPSAT